MRLTRPPTKQELVAKLIRKLPLHTWYDLRSLAMQIPIKGSYMPPRDLAGQLIRYKRMGVMINKACDKTMHGRKPGGRTMWKKIKELHMYG